MSEVPVSENSAEASELDRLIAVMHILRGPGGCPWDGEQNHESLVRYLIEESFELVDAIESGNREDLIEELGDVLYQVLFHADLASETSMHAAGWEPFNIQDVAKRSREKMVGRHPHVFSASGDLLVGDSGSEELSSEEVLSNWDRLKQLEKPERESALDGVPMAMPALLLADKLIGKALKISDPEQLIDIHPASDESFNDESELGERIFSLIAEAKSRGLDTERALRSRLRVLKEQMIAAEESTATD
ncbi:MAG: MazG family protein [Microbacteriaceae bacterium]